jgi:tRNA G18 (ribose-2'-O)-methylase SpoU
MNKTLLILENIRSAHNVGAIFRTAEGAGVSKIFLIGYTPAPVDRFGREQPEIIKTSLGASKIIPWDKKDSIEEVIKMLQKDEVEVIVVEQSSHSTVYNRHKPKGDRAFVFGNEIDGVSAAALAAADHCIDIPMSGQKESLNVATTVGVILFHFRDCL